MTPLSINYDLSMGRGWATRDKVDREGTARRADLLRAAREAFEDIGFAETPVSEISRRAGVSRASFYVYFSSKQDVLNALVAQLGEQYADAQAPVDLDLDDVEQVLAVTLRAVLATAIQNFAFMQVIDNEALRDADVRRMWAAIRNIPVDRAAGYIRRAYARGLVDPVISPDDLAWVGAALADQYSKLVVSGSVSVDSAAAAMQAVWLSLVRPCVSEPNRN